MLQPRGQRRPWQYVRGYSGNPTAQGRMSPPEKRRSPNTPLLPSPSSAINSNNHPHYQHDRMVTGGSLPSSPQSNMIPGAPGAPHRQNQGSHMPHVSPLRLSQMDGQVDAREGRVRRPNQIFAGQEQQTNIRNRGAPKGGTAAARRVNNQQRQLARNDNINLTPPENLGK